MFVIEGTFRTKAQGPEYVATDLRMKNKEDQSFIVRSLDLADKFNTKEEAENYLDEYNLRNRFWKVVEI